MSQLLEEFLQELMGQNIISDVKDSRVTSFESIPMLLQNCNNNCDEFFSHFDFHEFGENAPTVRDIFRGIVEDIDQTTVKFVQKLHVSCKSLLNVHSRS